MNICVPVTNLTFEGNVVFDLMKELARRGQKIKIIAPHAKGLPLQEKVAGVEVKRFRYFWPLSLQTFAYGPGIVKNLCENPLKIVLLPFFFAAFSLKIFLEARECDVIHANWLPSAVACFPAKILLRKPVLLTVHGTDVRNAPKVVIWVAVKASDAVTTSHEGLVEKIKSAGGKVEIVRNMIDFDLLEKPGSVSLLRKEFNFWSKPVVLFVGRFIAERDPFTFIKAAKLLQEANFVMLGDGKLLEKAKLLAEENRVKNVFFLGRRKDVALFLKLSAVFVSTATFDNVFSSVVVEAGLAGKPLVLTNVGKTGVFFNEKNSVLFQPGNAEQLAASVKELLANGKKAASIAKEGRALMKRAGFDRNQIVERNKQLYRKLTLG